MLLSELFSCLSFYLLTISEYISILIWLHFYLLVFTQPQKHPILGLKIVDFVFIFILSYFHFHFHLFSYFRFRVGPSTCFLYHTTQLTFTTGWILIEVGNCNLITLVKTILSMIYGPIYQSTSFLAYLSLINILCSASSCYLFSIPLPLSFSYLLVASFPPTPSSMLP